MKKPVLLLLSLLLIISLPIFAEDKPADPSAGVGVQGDISMDASQLLSDDTASPAKAPQGDVSVQGSISTDASQAMPDIPGTPGGTPQDPGQLMPDNSGAPEQGATGLEGMDQMPGDTAAQPQTVTAQKQSKPAPAAKKVPAPVKPPLPKYKAVPYTNDLRIMDAKTGELGQVDTLHRYMDWRVKASTSMEKKKHFPTDTNDLNAYTAWVENKDGYGEGESLTLYMDPIYFSAIEEGGVDSVKCTGLKIINGYNKSHEDWFNNSRVKIMKIYQNNKPFCLIELYDSTNWQDIKFKKPMMIKPGDTIKAKIVEVFEGYKYANAAITEFLLVGKPGGSVIGYDQMNGKSMTNVRNGGMYFK